jgi:D-xylose reductase
MFPKFENGEYLATPLHKIWAELERLVEAGLIKNIGVSNCTVAMLIDLWSYAKIKPVMNQIELHPYLPQVDLVNFIRNKLGVHVTGYSPIGASGFAYKHESLKDLNLFKEPAIISLAEKHGKSPAQIVLNWHIQHRGHVVIPKTTKVERLSENLLSYNFKLSEEEYAEIDKLANGARFFNPINWGHY